MNSDAFIFLNRGAFHTTFIAFSINCTMLHVFAGYIFQHPRNSQEVIHIYNHDIIGHTPNHIFAIMDFALVIVK